MLILETFEFFQFMVAGFMDNQFERNVFLELSELPAYCISELTKYIYLCPTRIVLYQLKLFTQNPLQETFT